MGFHWQLLLLDKYSLFWPLHIIKQQMHANHVTMPNSQLSHSENYQQPADGQKEILRSFHEWRQLYFKQLLKLNQ